MNYKFKNGKKIEIKERGKEKRKVIDHMTGQKRRKIFVLYRSAVLGEAK